MDGEAKTDYANGGSAEHPCEVTGCTCPNFISSGLMEDFCAREGCGHRDIDHKGPWS